MNRVIVRRRFVGDISDFNALNTPGSQFAGAWAPVQNQLLTEGNALGSTAMTTAKNAFATQYLALTQGAGVMNIASALQGAQGYVLGAQTVYGAVQNVSNLAAMANGGNVAGALEGFTGLLVAAAVAGGVSAGIGAAIIGVVDGVLAIMQKVGLFGSPPTGTQVTPGFYCTGASFAIPRTDPFGGTASCCVWASPAQIVPGSLGWRSFPDPNAPADAVWFTPTTAQQFQWGQATFGTPGGLDGGSAIVNSNPVRPIDWAFPQYHALECMPSGTDAVSQLYAVFFAAWRLNAAYALNGLTPQKDAQVLLQVLELWNRAHPAGTPVTLTQTGESLPAPGSPCDPNAAAYPLSLISGVIDAQSTTTNSDGSQANYAWATSPTTVSLNTGGLPLVKLTPVGGAFGAGVVNAGSSGLTHAKISLQPGGLSTGKKIALATGAVVGVGAASMAGYGLATGQGAGYLFGAAGDLISGYAGRFVGEAREAFGLGAGAAGKMKVQSLLFPRDKFTTAQAKAWAKKHGYKHGKVDVTAHYIRMRQRDPSDFKTERTIPLGDSGVKAVVGRA